MRSTFKILLYINKSKVRADGKTAILCRITIDGASVVLTTGESIAPEAWSVKRGESEDKKVNQRLQALKAKIEEVYTDLLQRYGVVSAELLKQEVLGANKLSQTLLAMSEAELKLSQGAKPATYQANSYGHRDLVVFMTERGEGDMPLQAVSLSLFEAYRLFLKRKVYAPKTINQRLCWLSRLMYRAVSQGMIRYNPFVGVSYEKAERKPRFLTKGEVIKLLSSPMQDKTVELCRQMFLFSVFTGLAMVDVLSLKQSQVERSHEGRLYIRKARQKTEVESLVPLHPIAEEILCLYTTTRERQSKQAGRVFPEEMTKVRLSALIKVLGMAIGLRQGLTFHMARHTFGTLTLEAGISIESIAKMLGHRSLKSTQIYAQITDQKIAEDMGRAIEQIQKEQAETNSQ